MMMDVMELSPYLSGIQEVAGSKLSDKFNTLNLIAKKITESENQNDSMQLAVDSSELPEALKPLVQVEVARLSGQFEGISEALKSDDSVVFDRALRAKWFFNGSHENCRVQYYQAEIFPVVSLQSRLKIIKTLANNLTANPAIAEEFYTKLTLMYGEKQAHPLLMACSESFIWNCITEHKVRLNNRLVRILFYKYPGLVVKYLKLSKKSDDQYERNLRLVDLNSLSDFLPRLVKKCPNTFTELVVMHNDNFNIKLSRVRTELFLKTSINSLMKNVKLFMPMLDLKTMTTKLTEDKFKSIIVQLFPPAVESFEYRNIYDYLTFFPESKKTPLILSAFEQVYKANLLDCTEKITPQLLRSLPRDERIKQARIKLEEYPTDECSFSDESWICYLPCEEAIKSIKTILKRTSSSSERYQLLQQLIYTCVINLDNHSLLEVFKYIASRHKNEYSLYLTFVLITILEECDLKSFTRQHWEVLFNFIKFIQLKSGTCSFRNNKIPDLVIAEIRYNLINNYPIDDRINFMADVFLDRHNLHDLSWNILTDNLLFEKRCLDDLLNLIPMKAEEKKLNSVTFISNILKSIYEFNERNSREKSPFPRMSIRDRPWLFEKVKEMFGGHMAFDFEVNLLESILKNGERDIYDAWVGKEEIDVNVESEGCKILKNNPEKIMEKWEWYLEQCTWRIKRSRIQRFVRMCCWYQDLGIDFADRSLEDVGDKKVGKALVLLAVMVQGSTLERIVEPFVPTSAVIDPGEEDVQANNEIRSYIPLGFKVVNPPVSLDFILKFCAGDYIHTIVSCLVNVSRRTALPKVISFAMTLMDRPVSIKKHGIRLFCMVADVKQSRGILMDLWRSETHQTIRTLVFKKVFKVFETDPNDETWRMISECIEGLNADDLDIFKSLLKFDFIPNEYIADYVQKLFSLFRSLVDDDDDDEENGLKPEIAWSYIIDLLNIDIKISILFSEDLNEEIINEYILDLSLPENVLTAAYEYLINCYILHARSKLEQRLKRLKEIFIKHAGDYYNSHLTEPNFHSGYFFVRSIFNIILSNESYDLVTNRLICLLIESFTSIISPHQDPIFYLNMKFASLMKVRITPRRFACKVGKRLPSLVKIFSPELMGFIAKCLYTFSEFSGFQSNFPEYRLDMIEALMGIKNESATILAAYLLSFQKQKINDERFQAIFDTLKNHTHPGVLSAIHIAKNKPWEKNGMSKTIL